MIAPDGVRIRFRDISEQDAYIVCLWRNTQSARDSFFTPDVVTPDTHRLFMRNRKPHDLVWMIELAGEGVPIGMTSLTIDTKHFRGEYGRAFIGPEWRSNGFAKEQEYLLLYYAFEFFRLDQLWLDAYVLNEAILKLHEKTGWGYAGYDLPGHTDPRGHVAHMTYTREAWKERRAWFIRDFPSVRLPEWVE